MNRILFEKEEIKDGIAVFGGERAEHVLKVLHGGVGQILKTGEIGGRIGSSKIVSASPLSVHTSPQPAPTSPQPAPTSPQPAPTSPLPAPTSPLPAPTSTLPDPTSPLKDPNSPLPDPTSTLKDPKSPLKDPIPPLVEVAVVHDADPLPSWCDLILAPPRPRVMKRLLPQLATLGVGRIVLVGAKKVEKDFWGATLLKPENYRPLLIDGLMQGGVATELPVLETRRNFRRFIREELDLLFPAARKVVAHPYADGTKPVGGTAAEPTGSRLLLAVGPEGGWTDEEVALLEEHGFARYSLGRRILRTDTALIALLSQFMEK